MGTYVGIVIRGFMYYYIGLVMPTSQGLTRINNYNHYMKSAATVVRL